MQVGQIFTHTVARPWTSKTCGKGVEVVVYRSKVTYADDRRFEYENLERLSVADPLPETDGCNSSGGGMANCWADKKIAKGELVIEQ